MVIPGAETQVNACLIGDSYTSHNILFTQLVGRLILLCPRQGSQSVDSPNLELLVPSLTYHQILIRDYLIDSCGSSLSLYGKFTSLEVVDKTFAGELGE